jgi:hypothetical protein
VRGTGGVEVKRVRGKERSGKNGSAAVFRVRGRTKRLQRGGAIRPAGLFVRGVEGMAQPTP